MTINLDKMNREDIKRSVAESCANGNKEDLISVFMLSEDAQRIYYSIQKQRIEHQAFMRGGRDDV